MVFIHAIFLLHAQTYLREVSALVLLAPPCFPTKEERGELISLPSRDFVLRVTAAMLTLQRPESNNTLTSRGVVLESNLRPLFLLLCREFLGDGILELKLPLVLQREGG